MAPHRVGANRHWPLSPMRTMATTEAGVDLGSNEVGRRAALSAWQASFHIREPETWRTTEGTEPRDTKGEGLRYMSYRLHTRGVEVRPHIGLHERPSRCGDSRHRCDRVMQGFDFDNSFQDGRAFFTLLRPDDDRMLRKADASQEV